MQPAGRKNAFALHRKTIAIVVLGIVVGSVVGFIGGGLIITAEWSAMQTTVNGWSTAPECGEIGNNILVQAACAEHLPLVNLPQEAVYWRVTVDGAGQILNGQHDYILYFPPGGLPPNNAFWSVTMNTAKGLFFVNNSIDRYEVSGTSGLVSNANGSSRM
jgi:hypothetical protein